MTKECKVNVDVCNDGHKIVWFSNTSTCPVCEKMKKLSEFYIQLEELQHFVTETKNTIKKLRKI